METYIVESTFNCITPAGDRFPLVVRITELLPMEGEFLIRGYFRCMVWMDPLCPAQPIGAASVVSALAGAVGHIRRVFKSFVAQGGQLFYPEQNPDSDSPINPDDPAFLSFIPLDYPVETRPVGPSHSPMRAKRQAVANEFRALHNSGCFVVANPWDTGSARFLEVAGYKALATTSAGAAFSRGLPDHVDAMTVDEVLDHISEIVYSTELPVTADFQAGYAEHPEGVATNVTRCVDEGVAGLSIEDATGRDDAPLYSREAAIERVRAAREAIDRTGVPVVLTARCESFLFGVDEPLKVALDRLVAFADAGADCLYAPGVADVESISAIISAVAPKPVNVLVSRPLPGLSIPRLAELGVRRVSVGSAFARIAWASFMKSATELLKDGNLDALDGAAKSHVLNQLFDDELERV